MTKSKQTFQKSQDGFFTGMGRSFLPIGVNVVKLGIKFCLPWRPPRHAVPQARESSLSDQQFFNRQDTKARKNKRPYHEAFLGVFVVV
jgi:hypothetical protein